MQCGAALLLGLIVLLIMTMVAISAMQTTVLEERMAGNLRDRNIAFQAAEAGLQAGLDYVERQTRFARLEPDNTTVWPGCRLDSSDEDCARLSNVLTAWASPTDDGGGGEDDEGVVRGTIYSDATFGLQALDGVGFQPRVYIEKFYADPDVLDPDDGVYGAQKGRHYYTVVAVGYGATGQTRVVLQATVMKYFQ